MKPYKGQTSAIDRAVDRLLRSTGAARPSSDLKARTRIFLGAMLLLLVILLHKITSALIEQSHIDALLPSSMVYLGSSDWLSFGVTAVVSIVTFILAVGFSYFFGLGTALLATSRHAPARLISLFIDTIFRFLYIVPVVLTTSMVFAILLGLYLDNIGFPAAGLVIGTIIFSTICIGGYPIYFTIYTSVVAPDRRHALLVDALYHSPRRVGTAAFSRRVAEAVRLTDGKATTFCEGIERAWHLTIVAVVIVESIVPGLYQYIGVSEGIKGIGRSVIEAQSLDGTYRVMGFMWALFLFDLAVLSLVKRVLQKKYLRHYQEK